VDILSVTAKYICSRTWSRVGLREQECDYRLRMIAETYSTVGRSLPLTFLNVWEKYRERWGADDGRKGFGCVYCRSRSFETLD
jgi:hypothetical protein